MATSSTWTVVFEDKKISKNAGDAAGTSYKLVDASHSSFWSDSKWSNIWAIQYGTSPSSDEVEHRDTTPHGSWSDSGMGSFEDQFINKWDAAHLAQLQDTWDNDNVDGETEAEKISRTGARPSSYSSL